jgi:Na+/H+-dicarboxylate symporter
LALHWKILLAMLLGVAWALISGELGCNSFTINWVAPFGTIFINCLKFIAVPLVLFSIVTGVSSLGDLTQLGRMGAKTLGLYLITTVLSVSTGLLLVNAFSPGIQSDKEMADNSRLQYELWAKDAGIPIKDDIRLSETASAEQIAKIQKQMQLDSESSDYQAIAQKSSEASSTKESGPLQPLVDMVPSNIFVSLSDGSKMLQVIVFALFFGISLSLLPKDKSETVTKFFEGANEVFIKMVNIIMGAAPFFVFCLMSGVLVKVADTPLEIWQIFKSLGQYSILVVLGLAILLFGFYPLLMKIFRVPIKYGDFFRGMSPAQFLAFSTSSSAATLPVTLECVEKELKIPKKIADFVLPIGATVNMDGTSLYQAIAVIFLAQYHGVDLTLMQQLGIVGTTTLASIGAAAVPSAGLIMLMIVLTSVGLNPLWIVLIYPMDRLLDMCRTVINVTSDATVTAIVAKSEGEF